MYSINEAVIQKPEFEKVATYKMSKEVSQWNDEILEQFYQQTSYIPKELSAEVVINAMDDKKGYAKGSVVVWNGDRKVNYPIIIKEYNLSPFDVIVTKEPGANDLIYLPADESNLKRCLSSQKMGNLQNLYDVGQYQFSDIKEPGGVPPKFPINIDDAPIDLVYPPFSKMSSLARKEDLDKLANQLDAMPDVAQNFVDNTQDLVQNIINLRDDQKRVMPSQHQTGVLDINDVIKSKRVATVIDSQMFDVNSMVPVKAPSAAELRVFAYPSMEDFMESGAQGQARFDAIKTGKPVAGIVLDYKSEYDIGRNQDSDCSISPNPPTGSDPTSLEEKRSARQRRDQIFISLDGRMFSTYSDYGKSGIGFYGSRVMNEPGVIEKAVKMISEKGYSCFTNHNRENMNDGSDKSFSPIPEKKDGIGDRSRYGEVCCQRYGGDVLVIYGAGDAYECFGINGKFKKMTFNDSNIYVNKEKAVIPANVAGVQKVTSVTTPIYKMLLDGVKSIYLVPETSVIINMGLMRGIDRDEFLSPSRSIKDAFEKAEIMKVAMKVSNGGFSITGPAYEPLKKIASLSGSLNTQRAISALMVLGMEKIAAIEAMKVAVDRAELKDSNVYIYGVTNDYVSANPYQDIEKRASRVETLKKIAIALRKDLVKEASAITDPSAVDAVLSLNFINEDSLNGYIDQIGEMRKVVGKLCEMLVASRMGLTEIDEGAVKKCVDGLNETIKGLERVKMAVKA